MLDNSICKLYCAFLLLYGVLKGLPTPETVMLTGHVNKSTITKLLLKKLLIQVTKKPVQNSPLPFTMSQVSC